MSVLLIDGFDHYQAIGGTLTGVDFPNIGYTITATSANLATIGTGSSNNSRAIALQRTASGTARISKQVTSEGDVVTIGFALHATARETIVSVTDLFTVEWLPSGYPQIGTEVGTVIPILNTWYYYELVINKPSKQVTLWINGYEQFTASFDNDAPDTLQVVWGWNQTGTTAVLKLDDLLISDDLGDEALVATERVGPVQVATRLPSANSVNEWTPSVSQKQNWQIVSQIPANQLEYVQSNALGAVEEYISATPVTGEVVAVAVAVLSAKADVDDHSISLRIRDGANVVESDEIPLSLQFTYNQAVFERDAAGAAWTPENATNARFGAVVK